MAVTFPRTAGKVEIISSALIDHLKWSRLFQHGSALARRGSYFCSTLTSLEPPADITARALPVREHWHIACETSRGLFSWSIFCPVFFSSHITACHTSSLCCQLDTVAYHFHYLQSLTFYFMLVSPCPQFRFLSTFPVPLHFLFTPWLSPIQRRCLLKLQNVASRQ